jgi:protein-S-isoprenylcysteine O-methyltransferase Ste14|tara:strand:+ start:338 stop:1069 length:732 start_codon:yes stop_codon:yes gene_type:complete
MGITEITYLWIIIALIIFPINLIYKAPYGKHSTKKWGKTIDNKTGWILMEFPALITCPLIYYIVVEEISLSIGFIFIWITHYFNRTIIYPLKIKTKGKKIPIAIVASAFFFNVINGILNGYFIATIPFESISFTCILIGFIIFIIGLYINISSDNTLIKLRTNQKGYVIPKGGLFNYVSCPNFFGEIIEWLGFAIMTLNLGSISFLIWTICNLIPRSKAHHNWYKENFEKYPSKRKAVIPYLL